MEIYQDELESSVKIHVREIANIDTWQGKNIRFEDFGMNPYNYNNIKHLKRVPETYQGSTQSCRPVS